jgi:uncharacterized protein (TIGR00369 family)
MNIKTHQKATMSLLGKPIHIEDDAKAIVELTTSDEMSVDEQGLIHGGFTFSLADYAAMLAVNDPNVVLGASNVKFLAPVKIGDTMKAVAVVEKIIGKKRVVLVEVFVGETRVLSGEMQCYVLSKHVLE